MLENPEKSASFVWHQSVSRQLRRLVKRQTNPNMCQFRFFLLEEIAVEWLEGLCIDARAGTKGRGLSRSFRGTSDQLSVVRDSV